jgi:MOSC domain-containing protein YiiM
MTARIVALHRSPAHSFSKQADTRLNLIKGEGVEGDAHRGVMVKHRSRVAADPTQPNLRQVHLLHREMIEDVNGKGFTIKPGDIGENITTEGIDLLALPRATLLAIGETALLEVTGLRNPCIQLDQFQPGLMKAFLGKADDGSLIRKAGIMTIVREGGEVREGDGIRVILPDGPHVKLDRV